MVQALTIQERPTRHVGKTPTSLCIYVLQGIPSHCLEKSTRAAYHQISSPPFWLSRHGEPTEMSASSHGSRVVFPRRLSWRDSSHVSPKSGSSVATKRPRRRCAMRVNRWSSPQMRRQSTDAHVQCWCPAKMPSWEVGGPVTFAEWRHVTAATWFETLPCDDSCLLQGSMGGSECRYRLGCRD